MLTDLETSAREVTNAAKGTAEAVRHPGRALRAQEEADREQADRQAKNNQHTEPPTERPTASASDTGAAAVSAPTPGEVPDDPAIPERRVEVPQQDEAGVSRDWSNADGLDDAM